ncbi:hypothetical protein F3157_22650 [Virgibacillus dakarensis]|uniref:hypothetical protein n=1 Tax=Virgibacillus dakarensis TaxID=1917889 RepID=UPI0012D9F4C0|nr:hypothetical protein [Virgibacillus dakarensis]MTW88377.1 hypothetical protein [Virgibacillus dakarensis]
MKKNKDLLDYNAYYESILSTEDDVGKVNASDFIEHFSELIIKHSATLENKFLRKGDSK